VLPDLPFDAITDASNAADLPALALDLVEPGGRVVYVRQAGTLSTIDTRTPALKDVTAVGILSASPGLADTMRAYSDGNIDPRFLVAATVGLDQIGDIRTGRRPTSAGPGPKIHVTPGREPQMNEFEGLTAFVTGGGSGIGAAIASLLLNRGARRDPQMWGCLWPANAEGVCHQPVTGTDRKPPWFRSHPALVG